MTTVQEVAVKLLPCPFCGGENLSMDEWGETNFYVVCDTCETTGPEAYEEAKAIEKWNTRPHGETK